MNEEQNPLQMLLAQALNFYLQIVILRTYFQIIVSIQKRGQDSSGLLISIKLWLWTEFVAYSVHYEAKSETESKTEWTLNTFNKLGLIFDSHVCRLLTFG